MTTCSRKAAVRPGFLVPALILAASLATHNLSAAPNAEDPAQRGEEWTVAITPAGSEVPAAADSDVIITPALAQAEPTEEAAVEAAAEPAKAAQEEAVAEPAAETEAPEEEAAGASDIAQPAQAEVVEETPAVPGSEEEAAAGDVEESHGVIISPARASDESEAAQKYLEIYRAIPYSYSAHLVNPSYRHDATMELLLGKPRPTVINRNSSAPSSSCGPEAGLPYIPPFVPGAHPLLPYRSYLAPLSPFGYYDFSRGPYSRYQRLFGYEGGWRPMYYVNGGYGSPYSPWF